MKIGILYEVWGETEEYPGSKDTVDDDTTVRRRRKRPKLDREEVFQALTKLGHEPSYIELDGREKSIDHTPAPYQASTSCRLPMRDTPS